MDTTVADELIGTTIDGRYRITGRVARGGMATVYTAVDERLERTVALKIIHPSQATNVHFVDRFTDEAKTIARLTHPNVVAVYDQGRHLGLPYLVMEYVQGRTLRDLITQRRRLNPVEALAILEQMLSAIAAAHRAGLVHRDVKPENVLVAEAPSGGIANLVDSVVKVADFGLARAVEASSSSDDSGHLMATVAYVAPELVTDGHADARTDVYSAGIVLFEMVTGQVPYDGDEPVHVAWQHVDNDVPAPSTLVRGLPTAIDELVARATRRDPGARPTDAGALLAEVQVVRDDLGAANVETALLRQIPARHAAEATAMIPAITTAFPPGGDRPTWARLPEQKSGRPRRGAPPPSSPLARVGAFFGGDNRRATIIIAVALMVITVIGSTWYVTLGRYTDTPTLVNMTRAQAEQRAQQGGFDVIYADGQYDDNVAKDTVLKQDPPQDDRIVRGGVITLTLSLGAEQYPVPDVVGMELSAAKGELDTVKLKLKEGTGKYSDAAPEGTVISSDPKAGTPLKPGQTVTVVISKGRAPITVPDLTKLNINDARAKLKELGLSAVESYKESDAPKDEVIGQSPKPGTGVEKEAEVKLDVSTGPPLVTVPRVLDLPCAQGQQALQAANLQARIDFNPNGVVRGQQPPEGQQVPPQTLVAIQCF
ncbi:Stk1 family PASTA domain-containing Ser/Thr kinase [Actinoplanes sp. NPDC051633]|uniref:Stk1 family PASTA domain-containing Ser/Thr kinase n=1 Tax=Actinoplanes sp. NPDC051633 TaxID=3155670 RepID=UPI00342153E7